ncbi:MAG: DUF4013 domain-containing protein [Chloroflexi bacterium]|nr:DUF4013 domain-containing protein [Chloroflexota bacterium]
MSFSNAFRYPFQNFARVLSIVLVMTIAFAVFIGLLLNSHDWSPLIAQIYGLDPTEYLIGEPQALGAAPLIGVVGLIAVAVLSGFWISGYSIEVIRSVWAEIEYLPDFDFGRNVKDGFYLFLSSVAYWIILIVLLVVEMFIFQATSSLGAINALVAIIAVPLTVIVIAIMGWAYFVGMARFAAGGDHRVVYQIRRNMRTANVNWTNGAGLVVYMIVLSIIYGIVRGIVDGIFGNVAGMLGITLSIVIYYVFNLMQHFSTQHLIAQYAVQIGIGGDDYEKGKAKVDFS